MTRYYEIEKAEKATKRKALLFTVLLHLTLVGGLIYFNHEDPASIVPDFVKEWFAGDADRTVVSKEKLP